MRGGKRIGYQGLSPLFLPSFRVHHTRACLLSLSVALLEKKKKNGAQSSGSPINFVCCACTSPPLTQNLLHGNPVYVHAINLIDGLAMPLAIIFIRACFLKGRR